MKILFLAGTLNMGGAEKQLYYIMKAAVSLNYEVSMIVFRTGEHWEEKIRELPISVYALPNHLTTKQRLFRILKIARSLKPDIIQSQHFYTNFACAFAAKISGAVCIGGTRSDVYVQMTSLGKYGRLCMYLQSAFVANSEIAVKQLQAFRPKLARRDRIYYLQNVIDIAPFNEFAEKHSTYVKNELRILGVGRLVDIKQWNIFLKIVEYLNTNLPDHTIKATLIGGGPEENSLVNYVKQNNIQHLVEFLGPVVATPDYYSQADIFLLPSEAEGTPNVILEAMAAGLPIFSTTVGQIPQLVNNHDSGRLRPPTEAYRLGEDIIEFIQKDNWNKIAYTANRKFIKENFSTEILPSLLSKMYSKLTGTN